MIEAVSGQLLAELGPDREADEVPSPVPDTGAVHGFDEDQKQQQFIL